MIRPIAVHVGLFTPEKVCIKKSSIWDVVRIEEVSVIPKYMQIVNSVVKGVEQGAIQLNERMPSINEVSFELDVSRDTVEKSYRELKNMGILESIPSKGYFIKNIDFKRPLKVILLFDKLSTHKKMIYDAFVNELNDKVNIDFYVYNNDFSLFKKIIYSKKEDEYSHFVIIPPMSVETKKVCDSLAFIPKEKLILLDKQLEGLNGNYAAVYENFGKDIYLSLTKMLDKLRKYDSIKLIFPSGSNYPEDIKTGFFSFCQDYVFDGSIISSMATETIEPSTVYINLTEEDLVLLIKKALVSPYKVGKEIGIISYNETPLKEVILDGLTTISTNFVEMGRIAAKLLTNNSRQQIENRFEVTVRNSL